MARANRDAVDDAWRIHDAQMEWTNRVDAKASFAFGIETVSVAAVTTLATATTIITRVGWWSLVFWVGLGLLAIAAVFASFVIAPVLRSRHLEEEARRDHIYFGHVRHLTPRELERRLRRDDLLPVLSRQIVRMAGINWSKHRRVQRSILFGVIGAVLVAVSVVVPHFIA